MNPLMPICYTEVIAIFATGPEFTPLSPSMNVSNKAISPAAINALKDALTHINSTKDDLKRFIYNTIDNKAIVGTIDWPNLGKYESVSALIDRMCSRHDIYRNDLLALFGEVINFNDLSHLKRWEDPDLKIQRAKDAIDALRKQAKGYFDIIEEKNKTEERKKATREKIRSATALKTKLDELYRKFLDITISSDPQKRGYGLDKFLNELFTLFDLDPKASFKITGEQIDGAFTFKDDDFLLEARWVKAPINASDLYSFAGKINGKPRNTLGLFVSIDGFSSECLQTTSSDLRCLILMNGMDLNAILTDRITLEDLLYRKRRHASETGNIYLSVNTLLVS
jgi:hypothetical protein